MTLVCFAVKEESRFFRPVAARRPDVHILLTGMGRRNAAEATQAALAREKPALVLSSGFAGGLRPELQTGDVLFSAENQPALERALLAAGAQPGRFHCAERIASTAAEKAALWKRTGAQAVEMESQIICGLCREKGVPSATVRVILDTADEDLPLDFNALVTPDQKMDYSRLTGTLLRSPGKLGALLRLQHQSRTAARKLAEVLNHVISVRAG